MEKFDALRKTNEMIAKRIVEMKHDVEVSHSSIFNSGLNHNIVHEGYTEETSYVICEISAGQKTGNLKEEEFKKLVCLEGKVKIYIPSFDEETIMNSLNSIFIPPNTEYSIEILEDCKMIGVYKPRKPKIENIINKRIYNKKKDE